MEEGKRERCRVRRKERMYVKNVRVKVRVGLEKMTSYHSEMEEGKLATSPIDVMPPAHQLPTPSRFARGSKGNLAPPRADNFQQQISQRQQQQTNFQYYAFGFIICARKFPKIV